MTVEEILERIPPAPAGVEAWIRKRVIEKTYLIYDKKEDAAVCTRCGHRLKPSRFPDVKHNQKGVCPKCHSDAIWKAKGIGRAKLKEYCRVLLFTHKGNTVYATLTELCIDFSGFGKPEIGKWLSAVYRFTDKEQQYFKHRPGWYWLPDRWEERKNVKLPAPPSEHRYYSSDRYMMTHIYEENLESVFEKSCLRYQYDRDMFESYEFNAYDYISYISKSLKYQSIELLRKVGFEKLVTSYVFGKQGSGAVNWRGKDLKKILRLPMKEIRYLKGKDIEFEELMVFRQLSEKERVSLDWGFIQRVSRDIYMIDRIVKYTSLTKWVEYNNTQGKMHVEYEWLDYIEAAKKLGWDLEDKRVKFPKNLTSAHDEAIKQVKIVKSRKLDEQFREAVPDFTFKHNGLIVVAAKLPQDLINESTALHHCVRTYIDRVAERKCLIWFIRKEDEPDEPYYTMETNPDGNVVQCRGNHNCSMTEEVKVLVEKFENIWKSIHKKYEGGKNAA